MFKAEPVGGGADIGSGDGTRVRDGVYEARTEIERETGFCEARLYLGKFKFGSTICLTVQ